MPRQIDKLTHSKLKGLLFKVGRHSDGNGLYLQVLTPGSGQWVLRYRPINAEGRNDRYMGLGGYPSVSLQKARELRDKALQDRLNGMDPIETRNSIKLSANKSTSYSFKTVANQLIKQKTNSWRNRKSEQAWRNTLTKYAFPIIGDLPVSAVSIEHIRQILDPLWSRIPVTAERLRGRIEMILDFAYANRWRTDVNPAKWQGMLSFIYDPIGKFHTVRNHPSLAHKKVPEFYMRLKEACSMTSFALRFQILTCARVSEVRAMKWSEIDWNRQVWVMPPDRSKNGKGIDVPLSTEAQSILIELGASRTSDYIFPSYSASGHLSEGSMNSLIKRMGYTDCVAHGFRSSFRVWSREYAKAPWDVAELCLCHSIATKTQQAYLRTDLIDERRQLLDAWASYCLTKVTQPNDSAT